MTQHIPLTIDVDGETIEVPGWMYVLAFALKGVPWAVIEADKPEFVAIVRSYVIEQRNAKIQEQINYHQSQIDELRKQLQTEDTFGSRDKAF